ncbi:YkgJ family cysteine cluster protein [Fulvivirga ulvae]|uniref:YkgJ family cysteine cluster protein n=1 Tax=Fulvivirga ulvae TaxID=2904245 RepID=UPI001F2D05D8|nr:YkgJ family cysteine cluster protein [Fulvivirga ulvae]UII34020.1 YkgJ family cysteine cluster protein [Fulvivirga ulvae]
MSIYRKVQAIERVFASLEREVATFQDATGMKCLSGCGLCCKKPDIAATPLEFLPLAYQLYKDGQAYKWFEELRSEPEVSICKAFRPFVSEGDRGFCGQYKDRGLICRLFGYSAMLDKQGIPQLVTCKTIKTEFPDAHSVAVKHIAEKQPVPVMRNFYFQLRAIDADLGQTLMPINKAIEEAIKVVLSYYSYRQRRGA